MRQAHIFYKDQLAGILTENDAGYEFRYLPEYISHEKATQMGCLLFYCSAFKRNKTTLLRKNITN